MADKTGENGGEGGKGNMTGTHFYGKKRFLVFVYFLFFYFYFLI